MTDMLSQIFSDFVLKFKSKMINIDWFILNSYK